MQRAWKGSNPGAQIPFLHSFIETASGILREGVILLMCFLKCGADGGLHIGTHWNILASFLVLSLTNFRLLSAVPKQRGVGAIRCGYKQLWFA